MLFNKYTYRKTNDKKLLHKIGKRWVTISITMLALLGGSFAMKSVTTHADTTNPVVEAQNTNNVKKQMNQNLDKAYSEGVQKQSAQATNSIGSSSASSVVNRSVSASAVKPSTVTSQANDMYHGLMANAMMNQHKQSGSTTNGSTASNAESSSVSSASNESANSSESKPTDVTAPSKTGSTNNSNVGNSGSSKVASSSTSASGNGMTTLNLGTESEQTRGWDFIQHGINNNDYDRKPVNSAGSSSVNNSASGDQTTPVSSASSKSSITSGSNSASKVPSNAPINARKPSFNSAYDSYMAQMSGTDSKVASMNDKYSNSQQNNRATIKLEHNLGDSNTTETGSYYGLNFKYNVSNKSLEFTNGTFSDFNGQSAFIGMGLNNSTITPLQDLPSFETTYQYFPNSIKFDDQTKINNQITNISNMFNGRGAPISSSIYFGSGFNTNNVTNMSNMLAHNSGLNSIYFGSGFNTNNVTNMTNMFTGCWSLKSITITSPNTKFNKSAGLPIMYKEIGGTDSSGNPYTSPTPNDFSKGNVGTFVKTPNPKPDTIIYQNDGTDVSTKSNIISSLNNDNGTYSDVKATDIPSGYHLVSGTTSSYPLDGNTHYFQVAPNYDFGSAVTQANTYNNGIPSVDNYKATSIYNKASGYAQDTAPDTNPTDLTNQFTNTSNAYSTFTNDSNLAQSAKTQASNYAQAVANDSNAQNENDASNDVVQASNYASTATSYANKANNDINSLHDGTTPNVYNFSSASNRANGIKLASANYTQANQISNVASGYAKSANVDTNSSAITNQHNTDNNVLNQLNTINGQIASANNNANTYISQLRNAIQASNYNNASADLSNAVSANNVANSLSNNNFATEAGSMTDSVSASIFNFASVDNETASIHPAVINSTTATSMSNKARAAKNSANIDTNSSAVNSQENRDTGDYNQVTSLAGQVTSANNLATSYINDVHNDSKTSNVSAIKADLANAQSANRTAQQLNTQLDNAENNMSDNVTPNEYNFSSANSVATNNIKLASVDSSKALKTSAIASGYASSAYVDSNDTDITNQSSTDTNLSNQMSSLAGQISTANGQTTSYINDVHNDSNAKNVNATIADLSNAQSTNGTAIADNNKLNTLASSMKDSTTPKGKTVNYTGNVILDYQTNGQDISDINGQHFNNHIPVSYSIPVAMNSNGSLFASKTASDYLKENTPAQLNSNDFNISNVTLKGSVNNGEFSPRTADNIITSAGQQTGTVSNDYVLHLNAKQAQPINVTFSDQAGNKQQQQVSGNGHYDYEKVSDIGSLAGVPKGYTANKTSAQFMDTSQNVTVHTTGNQIKNKPVKVTINKYIAGKPAGVTSDTVYETGQVGNTFTINPNAKDIAPSNYKSTDTQMTGFFTPTGLNQTTASFNYNEQPTSYNLAFYDPNNSDNLVSYQTNFKGYQGEKYNIVTASDAKNHNNPQSDIIIPSGYEPDSTNETVTLGNNTNLSINIKNNPNANQSDSADIPVIGHQITFEGNIKLHFQSSDNHDIKDLIIPYKITTSVDDTIQDLLEHGYDKNGNLPVAVPTDYINQVIQGFNTTNYSYAHNVNGDQYNNLWISPNMAGAHDKNASDQVSGKYHSSDNTYINPGFTLDFNALYPDDDTTNTNSPSNPKSNTNPTNSNSNDHGPNKAGKQTNIPNPWIPKNSDSPFNPSNPNSPFNPVSPFNPENPNSPFNPKNCHNNTNPNDPNSPYDPNNPNSILNPKNSNSPLNPSSSDSPLNPKNNPYNPNDTTNNPWNPLTPDSPLNPKNSNSPLNTKNSDNPDNTNNSGNNNNPTNPSDEHDHTPSDTPTNPTKPSDVPSTPQSDNKPANGQHTTPNGPSGDKGKGYNPYVPSHKDNHGNNVPDKTSDTPDHTNTTPNIPDKNTGSNTPASPNEANTTFYIKINDFNHGYLVQSYKKRINESKVGKSFTLNPNDYTTTGYQMSNGNSVSDESYTGYVSADGLMNKNNQPQNSIVWNYYAQSHTIHAHYINQHGKQLNPSDTNNNTVTGNTGDNLTPSDVDKQAKLPAGYHLVPNNNYQFKPTNNSDITYQVAGNDLSKVNAHITIDLDHDGKLHKQYTEPVSLQGKSVGDSDIIISPVQYQPTNDAYHTVPLDESPITIHVSDGNDFVNGNYVDNDKSDTTFTYDAKTAPSLVIRYVDIDPNAQSVGNGNDSKGRPIIESDIYSAKTLEGIPYNLDWVVGHKYTFGLVGSTNKNTVNLIKAPAGYDIVNDAQGFNYQNSIETMTLTKGTNYNGHPAMLLMVGLGAMPIHHHVQPKPNKHTNKPSSASVKPSSASVAPSSKASSATSSSASVEPNSTSVTPNSEASSASSSVAPSNVSPDIVIPSSNTNSVSSASTSTASSSNVAPSVSSASQPNSKASVESSVVNKITSASSAKPVVHKISKKSVSAKHIKSATPKAHVNKINKVNHKAVSEASNMPTKAVHDNSTTSVESGHQVATFEVHKANNNAPYVVAESEPTNNNTSATNVESAPVNNASNDEVVPTHLAVAKDTVASHNINNTNTNNTHKLPQTNEASSHSVLVAIVALLAGLSLMGVDLYRKHNN